MDPYYIRHYVSDRSDYEMIFRTTREQEGDTFFFNVTMQNHSGYAQGWNNLERTIDLPDRLARTDSSARQYFALARESDDAPAGAHRLLQPAGRAHHDRLFRGPPAPPHQLLL